MAFSVTSVDHAATAASILKPFTDPSAAPPAALEIESEAALRQFSQERLMSYGVDYADARELRARVALGEGWRAAAQDLAQTCLTPPEAATAAPSPASTAARLFRASALLRMSQMMFLADSAERRTIVEDATSLYGRASAISRDRRPVAIEAEGGVLAGWLHPAAGAVVGTAIVIGGVEGWAMDFGPLGVALARRGVHALLLDGPGQGQSRILNGYCLDQDWAQGYRRAVDYLKVEYPGLPTAFVGNSMGGSVATIYSAMDPRIAACVNNGGAMHATRAVDNPSFFKKMMTHCGEVTPDQALAIWGLLEPLSSPHVLAAPYLVVHGGMDPLVTTGEAETVFARATHPDKAMVTWSDGIHCVYNHEDDKQNLIGDWLASRLAAAGA